MTVHVLGVDPSLTATGLYWIGRGGDGEIFTSGHTLRSTGHNKDTVDRRAARLDTLTEAFEVTLIGLSAIDLAVIEGPSMGSVGGSSFDRAGLWWAFVRALRARDIPVAICAPGTRIKWATGSGRATKSTKSDVAVAVTRLWPGAICDGDNEWDALALATIGAQRLDWPVPTLARHAAAQTAIVWPTSLPARLEKVDLEESA